MLAGINEVVAPLGTALTEQQAALIRKYTKNVFLLYDSDQAGLKATFRSGDVLLAAGAAVRVISLPDGDDPDTFVANVGAAGFESAAAASLDCSTERSRFSSAAVGSAISVASAKRSTACCRPFGRPPTR